MNGPDHRRARRVNPSCAVQGPVNIVRMLHRSVTRSLRCVTNSRPSLSRVSRTQQPQRHCAQFSRLSARGFRTFSRSNSVETAVKKTSVLPEFYIVDSTLREGEQFATTEFTSQDRLYIAKMLDKMGVDYIEMVNPLASEQAIRDCEAVSKMGTRAKVVAHTRCHMSDVKACADTGIDGVNIYMATSPILSRHSHGKGIDEVIDMAKEVIGFVKKQGMEVRFSCEDAFRSNLDDILKIYKAVDALGVHRVGVADTVGIATPSEVGSVIASVRGVIKPTTGIEFHTHNDTGCCIANALVALEHGATHIDTCVLGIGERNGITPLGGFLARMYTIDKEAIKARFDLGLVPHLDKYVAQRTAVTIPFNNYITGASAFTHKAGVHSKAVMQSPDAYEVIDPRDWNVERRIQFAHRLTGWNAMKQRAMDLGLDTIPNEQIKAATVMIKNLSEVRSITLDEVDHILLALVPGRVESSAIFLKWKEAGGDGALDYNALAKEAVDSLPLVANDNRPVAHVRIKGHLFDKAVLNRCIDALVDLKADFDVVKMDVPAVNRRHSTATIRICGANEAEIEACIEELKTVVDGLSHVADCSMTRLDN